MKYNTCTSPIGEIAITVIITILLQIVPAMIHFTAHILVASVYIIAYLLYIIYVGIVALIQSIYSMNGFVDDMLSIYRGICN